MIMRMAVVCTAVIMGMISVFCSMRMTMTIAMLVTVSVSYGIIVRWKYVSLQQKK